MNQFIVLDRDGTIVVDKHYLSDPAGLEFAPGAIEGLQRMKELGCRFVIITNQSGIARGLITLEQVEAVNQRMDEMLKEIGVPVEGTYFCPHCPNDGCMCRKPESELFLRAAGDFGFDPKEAVVIGDKVSDVEFGKRLGALAIMVGSRKVGPEDVQPDYHAADLSEAAGILERLKS